MEKSGPSPSKRIWNVPRMGLTIGSRSQIGQSSTSWLPSTSAYHQTWPLGICCASVVVIKGRSIKPTLMNPKTHGFVFCIVTFFTTQDYGPVVRSHTRTVTYWFVESEKGATSRAVTVSVTLLGSGTAPSSST